MTLKVKGPETDASYMAGKGKAKTMAKGKKEAKVEKKMIVTNFFVPKEPEAPGAAAAAFFGGRGGLSGSGGGGSAGAGGSRQYGAGGSGTGSATASRLPPLNLAFFSELKRGEREELPCWSGGAPVPGTRCDRTARAIPLEFASEDAYLACMQGHTDAEFEAAVTAEHERLDRLESQPPPQRLGLGRDRSHSFAGEAVDPLPEEPGRWRRWRPVGVVDGAGPYVAVEGSDEWAAMPWMWHLVQVEGSRTLHLASSSGTRGSESPPCGPALAARLGEGEGYVVLRPPPFDLKTVVAGEDAEEGYAKGTRLRTLGFIGSHMLEYESAQMLRYRLQAGALAESDRATESEISPALRRLLKHVARPGEGAGALRHGGSSSLLPADGVARARVNASQCAAIAAIAPGLSLIHGPPGTGKSTTIFSILESRTSPGSQVLVTCTRNQAINAVAEKVADIEGGVLVCGNERCLREVAKRFTLKQRALDDPSVRFWASGKSTWTSAEWMESSSLRRSRWCKEALAWFTAAVPELEQLLGDRERAIAAGGSDYGHAEGCAALTRIRQLAADLAACLDAERKGTDAGLAELEAEGAHVLSTVRNLTLRMHLKAARAARLRVLRETRVFLCTIDSTPRLMHEMEEALREIEEDEEGRAPVKPKGPSRSRSDRARDRPSLIAIKTVIVDEAACVLETAIPILLRWGPENLILIGDHKQLRPFSAVDGRRGGPGDALMAGGHARSLMERAIDAGRPAPMLDVQYRMHPAICECVSRLIYAGRLRTAPDLDRSWYSRPVRWVDVDTPQISHPNAGYSNPGQATAVLEQVARVRGERPGCSIFVITFYNRQKALIERLMRERGGVAGVQVLSVDAVQGSEADVVVLSTVRCGEARGGGGACYTCGNEGHFSRECPKIFSGGGGSSGGGSLGAFMADRPRINVALSRARELCVIVGDVTTMMTQGGPLWAEVTEYYSYFAGLPEVFVN